MDRKGTSRNDPCPCGSGKKYKNCCLRKGVGGGPSRPSPGITDLHGKPKGRPEYPVGTVALYGPNDKITTKIAAGVITSPNAEPILMRWMATDVAKQPKVQRELREFFEQHGVKSVAMSEGNMGCPTKRGRTSPMVRTVLSARSGRASRAAIGALEVLPRSVAAARMGTHHESSLHPQPDAGRQLAGSSFEFDPRHRADLRPLP